MIIQFLISLLLALVHKDINFFVCRIFLLINFLSFKISILGYRFFLGDDTFQALFPSKSTSTEYPFVMFMSLYSPFLPVGLYFVVTFCDLTQKRLLQKMFKFPERVFKQPGEKPGGKLTPDPTSFFRVLDPQPLNSLGNIEFIMLDKSSVSERTYQLEKIILSNGIFTIDRQFFEEFNKAPNSNRERKFKVINLTSMGNENVNMDEKLENESQESLSLKSIPDEKTNSSKAFLFKLTF